MSENEDKNVFAAIRKRSRIIEQSTESKFTIAVESFSDDSTGCIALLCTGKRLFIPNSIVVEADYLGVIDDCSRNLHSVSLTVDTSQESGKLICQLAGELERVTEMLRSQKSRRSIDDKSENLSTDKTEKKFVLDEQKSLSASNSSKEIYVGCSGKACTDSYSHYTSDKTILSHEFIRQDGCQAVQIKKVGSKKIRVRHSSPFGTRCGESYSGKVWLELEFRD